MKTDGFLLTRAEAVADFERVRRQAALRALFGWIRGESIELLSYEDVRKRLRARETARRTLEDIPIDAIVGSAGRYQEFTRGFLPGKSINRSRWTRVKLAMTSMRGVPPIEVYRVGDAYFVQDGNHRISVAREMGMKAIAAYVTEVDSEVTVGADLDAGALIVAAEQAEFLQRTRARTLLPDTKLRLTATGQYPELLEHIEVHRYYMGEAAGREVSMDEALRHWHSEIYAPVVAVIRERGLLREFPQRTETDLYLWITRHRDELADALGWKVSLDSAASSLSEPAGNARRPARDRLKHILEPGPEAVDLDPQGERIVNDLLVVVAGGPGATRAVDLALAIAAHEDARLYGLAFDDGTLGDAGRHAVVESFDGRCAMATRSGQLAFAQGDATDAIVERSRLVDLVVAPYAQYRSTGSQAGALSPDLRALLRRCPRPVLCVPAPLPARSGAVQRLPSQPLSSQPRSTQAIGRVLLAYDASPKAGEALLIAAYLARWWGMHLTVLTVVEFVGGAQSMERRARDALTVRNVEADYVRCRGGVANAVVEVAQDRAADLLLMGGHGRGAALNLVLGSATTDVLKRSGLPVLVCQ